MTRCAAARQYTCNGSAMIAIIGRFAGLWVLLHTGCLFAADLVLSGGVEELTQETLTVRLADGRRITARLPKKAAASLRRRSPAGIRWPTRWK